MPEFSILVPVYNVEKYIKQCLRSIEKQFFDDFEVICVDDCSPDNSVKIVEEFMEKDDRIKLIRHKKNMKLGITRNTGIEHAKGKYVVFVDSDDWIEEDMLGDIHRAFELNKSESVWFNTYVHELNGVNHPLYSPNHPLFNANYRFNVGPMELAEGAGYTWCKAYKLENIIKSGIRFPAELRFEEALFYYEYFTRYRNACYIHKPLYHYRLREGSAVVNLGKGLYKAEDTLYEFLQIYQYLKDSNYFEEYKFALCKYLTKILNNHNLPNQHDKIVKLAKEVFEKIDFPNSFKDLETM